MFCFIKASLQNLQPWLCGRSMGHCTGGSKALDPGFLFFFFPEAACMRREETSLCGQENKNFGVTLLHPISVQGDAVGRSADQWIEMYLQCN